MKKILVTAGATVVPIDKVRSITNIFTGRTGASVAEYLSHNSEVIILTSNPDLTKETKSLKVVKYKTYDDLFSLMEQIITHESLDVIIHSAAVSDYKVDGVLCKQGQYLVELDKSGKVSSSFSELYLRLTPTIKIVDLIKNAWAFRGTLVKFKLQVGISDGELIKIAQKSMLQSKADFIVANCLEWVKEYAYIIRAKDGQIIKVSRAELPMSLAKEL